MKFNKTFGKKQHSVALGYQGFPEDHMAHFTSVAGYLIPVYWEFLDPGDKVTLKSLLKTRTQPLSRPASLSCIERIEWFAVPISQLYKQFSAKFFGINDIETDLLPTRGYSDYLPYIPVSEYNKCLSDLPITFETQSDIPSANLVPTYAEARRLGDAMGMPIVDNVSTNEYPAAVSAFPFAAYQKIYYDHYRLTDREENDPSYYNLDSYTGQNSAGTDCKITTDSTSLDRLRKLLTLRKRPYTRDYFTSLETSPLFGSQDVNASGSDLGAIQQWLNGLPRVQSGVPGAFTSAGVINISNSNPTSVRIPANSTASATYSDVSGMLNTANIRSLFAVEKLLEVTRNAKKHYDMQTLAHFGVKPPKGLAGECYKLGTHEQYLRVNEVISTANTEEGSLGELAGRGISEAGSKPIRFEADCHCVLMAIYSCEPVVNMRNEGIPAMLSMTKASEFFKSEFDSLGKQPMFRKELFVKGYNAETVANNNYNEVIGWKARYYQLKSRYNRSFAGMTSSYFSEWSLLRDSIGEIGFSRNFFYVWPTDLNNVLLLPYNGGNNYATMYADDYLINDLYLDIVKSSKKSVFGEPNF